MKFSDMQHFTASDRVKLSHHSDGFVQFSGESPGRIRSGKDPVTGKPKGLAIQSAPIGLPIPTGPTFGFAAWGIEEFRSLESLRPTDLLFPQSEIYYRDGPGTCNGYLVEGWVLWPPMWAGVHGEEHDLRISIGFKNFEGSGSNLEFRVVPLIGSKCLLALNVHRVNFGFPSKSGFQISGPSDRRRGATEANALIAMYPQDIFDVETAVSLDYVAPVQPPSDPAMLGMDADDAPAPSAAASASGHDDLPTRTVQVEHGRPTVGQPWWLVAVAAVLFVVGFYLEFTGKDGNSLPGAVIVAVGSVVFFAFSVVAYRRLRAAR